MKRKLLIPVIIATAIVVFIICYYQCLPTHRINQDTFRSIKVGMTYLEVEQLVGVPPGDYGPGTSHPLPALSDYPFEEHRIWQANETCIDVIFDKNHKVMDMLLLKRHMVRESFRRQLRRQFGMFFGIQE
jgi:hypothetical protein